MMFWAKQLAAWFCIKRSMVNELRRLRVDEKMWRERYIQSQCPKSLTREQAASVRRTNRDSG